MPVTHSVEPWMWAAFTAFVLCMLALDLGVFNRKAHEVKFKEALSWAIVWVALALLFGWLVYYWFGKQKALEYFTGYVIEKALSVDNLFVFIIIFSYFSIPPIFQHRILFWGILGALIMRAIFIFLGAALISSFHWILWIFGGFLIITGIKILLKKDEEDSNPEKNLVVRLFRRFIPLHDQLDGPRFVVTKDGKRFATRLLLVLVVVEATDVVFAVDSIPAVFAVSTDPFIVYTSNIFAILGLRSLYFLLAGIMDKFRFLKYGLGLVLSFVGVKMLLPEGYKIPIEISLLVILLLLTVSVVASLVVPARKPSSETKGSEE